MKVLIFVCSLQLTWSCISLPPPPPPPTTAAPLPPPTTAAPLPPGSCRCGVSKGRSSTRIVGGVTTTKNEFPWQVMLTRSDGSLVCGGSLLSSTTVLTAAHCTQSGLTAVFGEHDRSSSDGEVRIAVSRYENAPGYNSNTMDDDFAILTLASPVTFSETIYPICLPTGSSASYENRDSTVSGWGTIYSGGPTTRYLMKASVRTMSNSACTGANTAYVSNDITNKMICASESGKDSCQGDSGGPLITQKSGATYFEQIGVVSWGYGCARDNAPGVYARVTSRLSWIRSKMTGSTCPTP